MRRTIALAAVAGLALTGLSGTAHASDITPQQTFDFKINEVGFDLDGPLGLVTDANFVEVISFETQTESIAGWEIIACDAAGDELGNPTEFPVLTSIDDFVVAGDENYDDTSWPTRDVELASALDPDGGVLLRDSNGTPVHAVVFDPTPSMALQNCLGSITLEDSPSPEPAPINESAQRFLDGSGDPFWATADPTPGDPN